MKASNQSAVLLDELMSLETELHNTETRRNAQRMDGLLHPDFVEFGRSGGRYSRADVLNEFNMEAALPAIHADHFECAIVGEGVALLTYVSAHVDSNGNFHRHTLRSSIWVRSKKGWQMRFHQGTPVPDVRTGL